LELLRAVLDQFQVNPAIGVGKEDSLAVDTALRDVMRRFRQHHTSYASHESEQWPDGRGRLWETGKHAGCPGFSLPQKNFIQMSQFAGRFALTLARKGESQ
jgi:hypothetical protein